MRRHCSARFARGVDATVACISTTPSCFGWATIVPVATTEPPVFLILLMSMMSLRTRTCEREVASSAFACEPRLVREAQDGGRPHRKAGGTRAVVKVKEEERVVLLHAASFDPACQRVRRSADTFSIPSTSCPIVCFGCLKIHSCEGIDALPATVTVLPTREGPISRTTFISMRLPHAVE